jgi:hypothetical protein
VLARVIRRVVEDDAQRQDVDQALFSGINYLRAQRLGVAPGANANQSSALALRALDSFNHVVPLTTQDFLPEVSGSAEETVRSNALSAFSHYIDECLKEITVVKERLGDAQLQAETAKEQLADLRADLSSIKSARRVDLASTQRWRLFATISSSIALGVVGSLAIFHLSILKSLITEMGSILAILVSSVAGAIAGILIQRPEMSEPLEAQPRRTLLPGKSSVKSIK